MNETEFWSLIEASVRAVASKTLPSRCEAQADLLQRKLARRSPEEILEFETLFVNLMDTAFREDLWAAAYVICGGCSNDSFQYFRAWLIGQGRKRFEDALEDPETLATIPKGSPARCEAMLYVGLLAYRDVAGEKMPTVYLKNELQGEAWSEEDLPTMYPKLWAKFSD